MGGPFGARITGLELARDASHRVLDVLRAILDEHLLVLVPDQDLPPDGHLELASRWGAVVRLSAAPVSTSGTSAGAGGSDDRTGRGPVWRHGATHHDRPPTMAIAVARAVRADGPTWAWADQYAAYRSLSLGLRDTLDGLYAVHEGSAGLHDTAPTLDTMSAIHPVVASHERTRARALFVDECHTTRFDGWTAEESTSLLDHLFRVSTRDEIVARHQWSVGDVVIWDTRATVFRGDETTAWQGLDVVAVAGDMPRSPATTRRTRRNA